MGDHWSTALRSFLDYSNFYSIVVVLICLCCMVVFIIRLNGEHFAHRFYSQQSQPLPVPMTRMVGVNNPFMLSLVCPSSASLKDGVQCSVSCNQQSELYAYWGLDLSSTHIKMRKHWRHFLVEVKGQSLFSSDQCFVQDQPKIFDGGTAHTVHLSCENIHEDVLGQPPRLKYPLVVIIVPCDIPTEEPSVVAMVTIFHLRDAVCSGVSHIVYQYVVSNAGQVCPLQQLYVNQPDGATLPADDEQQQKDCVVCQNARASRALLPCRHACICSTCCQKVQKCPMCRSKIDSFFYLDGFEESQNEPPPVEEVDYSNMTWGERFEHWNERLNDMFGFT